MGYERTLELAPSFISEDERIVHANNNEWEGVQKEKCRVSLFSWVGQWFQQVSGIAETISWYHN